MDEMLKVAVKALDEKKAENITVLDFRGYNPLCDYFVISDVDNLRKLNAVTENVTDRLEEAGYTIRRVEGGKESTWVLIDAIDICINVFTEDQRRFYNLEKLWLDVPRVDISEVL